MTRTFYIIKAILMIIFWPFVVLLKAAGVIKS